MRIIVFFRSLSLRLLATISQQADGIFTQGSSRPTVAIEDPNEENTFLVPFHQTLVFSEVDGAAVDFEFLVKCTASGACQVAQMALAEFVDGEMHEKRLELGRQGCARSLVVGVCFRPVEMQTDV